MLDKQKLSRKLGKRLTEIRLSKRFTQEDLAHRADLNRAYIGYIERGERSPTTFTMLRIARALKVEFYELFI